MKFLKQKLLFGILTLLPCSGLGQVTGWGEIWSDLHYAYNNYSDRNDFILNLNVIRGGPRFYLLRKEPFYFSCDPYLEIQTIIDVFDKAHPIIYNDNGKIFLGGRGFFRYYKKESYFEYIQAEIYGEYRNLYNLSKRNRAQFEQISQNDRVGGLKIWSNSKPNTVIGFEFWSDISYRVTNFSPPVQKNYFITAISPYLLVSPWRLSILETPLKKFSLYYNPEIVIDLLNEPHNKNPYSNRILQRGGIRYVLPIKIGDKLNPGNLGLNAGKKYLHILFYADYSNSNLLENYYQWKLPEWDFRAGLMVYIPLGDNDFVKWRF